jgi:hypothetical protein
MRTRILRRLSLLLGSAIGAQACTSYEYGVMVAGYTIDGEVVDAATGEPIRGIELSFDVVTATSNAGGQFELHGGALEMCEGEACVLTATDVDGEENGSYQGAEVIFEPTPTAEPTEGAAGEPWEALGVRVELEPLEDSGLD